MSVQLYFGTVVRNAPVGRGGELVRLDWASKTVLGRVPVVPSALALDGHPAHHRMNGCRGIAVVNDQVIAADYHTLRVYDRELRYRRGMTHPLMAGLHELFWDGEGNLLVASTAADAVLECDPVNGEVVGQYWPREMPAFQRSLGVTPLDLDKQADHRVGFLGDEYARHPAHLHLNAAARWRGHVYALFNRRGVVADLTTGEVVISDSALVGAHNLLIFDDGTVVVNATHGRALRFYDLRAGALRDLIALREFPWVRALWRAARKSSAAPAPPAAPAARPLFVRGLDRLGDGLFVGLSPASILQIDWRKKELVDVFTYSDDVQVCVHGLKVAARRS